MGLFSVRAVGISWNSKGEFYGVLMEKEGQKYKILQYWTEKASSTVPLVVTLQKGYNALQANENDYLILGESGMKCSFVDLEQPAMTLKDMKKSLLFSLPSHFPIDATELEWCYRTVEKRVEQKQEIVRLLAIKKNIWTQWIDTIGTMKIDRLISPSAVCDAVLKRGVFISKENGKGFLLNHNEKGLLTSKIVNEDELSGEIFGVGSRPLHDDKLELNGLQQLEAKVQMKFAEPILLALYGLSEAFNEDKDKIFQIPQTLVPKRFVVVQSVSAILAIALFLILVFQGIKVVAYWKNDAAKIEQKIAYLQKETKQNVVDPLALKNLEELITEIETLVERPTNAKEILIEITEALPEDFYVTNFSVKSDLITCRISKKEESTKAPEELYNIFKNRPFFDNDVLFQPATNDYLLTLKVAAKNVKEESKDGAK